MKNEPNQNRIIILSVLAVMVYVFIIINSFYLGNDSFKTGFDGPEFRIIDNEQDHDVNESLTYPKVYYLKIKPRQGYRHYPDQIQNQKTDIKFPARYSSVEIAIPESQNLPPSIKIFDTLSFFLIFLIVILFIIIPFTFIRLIRSLYKGWVFHLKNIQRTRKLGSILVMIYLLNLGSAYLSHKMHQEIVSFQDYKLEFRFTDNYLLMMGVAILLMAEILARGLQIKEEQDLTI